MPNTSEPSPPPPLVVDPSLVVSLVSLVLSAPPEPLAPAPAEPPEPAEPAEPPESLEPPVPPESPLVDAPPTSPAPFALLVAVVVLAAGPPELPLAVVLAAPEEAAVVPLVPVPSVPPVVGPMLVDVLSGVAPVVADLAGSPQATSQKSATSPDSCDAPRRQPP